LANKIRLFSPHLDWNKLKIRLGIRVSSGDRSVADREYLMRQAMTLFKLAKSTNDPYFAAGFLDKAADLQSRLGESGPDPAPLAPDAEPPAA
jgi:hypothetical protein